MKFYSKDRQLLYEIDFDARKTYAELAKVLTMSKRGVEYKLSNLEKKGIILGYSPVIDMNAFGYNYYRVLVDIDNLDKQLEKGIETYILNDINIGWAIWTYGKYRIGFTIWAKTVSEFKDIINKFYFHFGKHIKERSESIATEVHFFKNKYLVNSYTDESLLIKEGRGIKKYDELDIRLLRELIKEPRAKIVTLAQNLNEPLKKTTYRLRQLYEKGILLGIRPTVNHQLLGKTYYKLFIDINNGDKEQIKKLETYLAQDKKVLYIVKALGACDIDVELIVDDAEELFKFMNTIQEKFPGVIKHYNSIIMKQTIKAQFLPGNL